jgi:ribonuclease HII
MNCPLRGVIAAVDEAGRGPLAGPVVSSCVVWEGLPPVREEVNDSKLLTEKQRQTLFGWIMENAYKVSVGIADIDEINELNILHASLLSMERAVLNTHTQPDLLLVDGLFALKAFSQSRAVVKGDRRCFFIASASIIAKVVRDGIMTGYDRLYPQYSFKKNKGYGTAEHKRAIEKHGITPLHRKNFGVVREYFDE